MQRSKLRFTGAVGMSRAPINLSRFPVPPFPVPLFPAFPSNLRRTERFRQQSVSKVIGPQAYSARVSTSLFSPSEGWMKPISAHRELRDQGMYIRIRWPRHVRHPFNIRTSTST